jgi:hypothetical protein
VGAREKATADKGRRLPQKVARGRSSCKSSIGNGRVYAFTAADETNISKAAPDFHHVVQLLRQLEPRYQLMELYVAQSWSDERLEEAAVTGDLPDRPGEIKPATRQ